MSWINRNGWCRTALLTMWISALFNSLLVNPGFAVSESANWEIKAEHFTAATAGYVSQVSILPGAQLKIFVTCKSKNFALKVFRMGYYDGIGADLRWSSNKQECIQQKKRVKIANTDIDEMQWIQPNVLDTTGFSAGFYLVRIQASDNSAAFINFVIRDISTADKVVLIMPLLTSAAYNGWTGASTYSKDSSFRNRNRHATFDAPNDWGLGSGLYLKYVHPLVVQSDLTNVPLAFLSDLDVATIPGILKNARAYVSAGHDEYWTQEEREAVLDAREQGTNLLFMGANVAYWRVRLISRGAERSPLVAIYKSAKEDPNKKLPTVKFRDSGEKESELTALNYSCYPASGIFSIKDTESFIFNGVRIPNSGHLNRIVGPETDILSSKNKFPGKIKVLAVSKVKCGTASKAKTESSQMIFGVSSSGAGTFSTGTMGWVLRGMSRGASAEVRDFVNQVTRNIITASSVGPLGEIYPI